jgi:hypothetical protein
MVDSQPDLHGPRDISCPSTSLCVAVDGVGHVLTSTDPGGGAASWDIADIDGSNELNGVSCPTSTFCVAVDGAGNVLTSTNPTGGAGAWTATGVDGSNFIEAVSCPSVGFCAASDYVGNVLTSDDPQGGPGHWSVTRVDQEEEPLGALGSISCASSTMCVAGSDYNFGDSLFASTNPTGGAGSWAAAEVGVAAIDCPDATLCVAGGFENNVETSTNPIGGTSAWSSTALEGGTGGFVSSISCPSTSFCVGATNNGKVASSSEPTGGPASWTVAEVDNARLMAVSCLSAPLCVAFDSLGRVLVGSPVPAKTLTVIVRGTGQVTGGDGFLCWATCSRAYADNAHVALNASAVSGSDEHFAGWAGGECSGTGPCEVVLDEDKTVTATFAPDSSPGGGEEPGGGGEQPSGAGGTGGGQATGGSSGGSSTTPAPGPIVSRPRRVTPKPKSVKCHRGFKKQKVHGGKTKCVRAKKSTRSRGHRGSKK